LPGACISLFVLQIRAARTRRVNSADEFGAKIVKLVFRRIVCRRSDQFEFEQFGLPVLFRIENAVQLRALMADAVFVKDICPNW
jgi:hypothetical protein